ncbi:MAG: efflux RND transporter permease subunit [candidate division WOR-3 bacterium]
MRVTEVSVKRPLAISMVFLGLLVFGIISITKLPVDLFPNITLPMMVVMTTYQGAGPQEVETQITQPFEKILGTLNNIEKITSTSSENSSMIMLQFTWGTDLDAAANDVRDRLGLILPYLPQDAQQPMIFKFDVSQQPVVLYSIKGNIDPLELDRIGDDIADRLQRVGGVAASFVESGVLTEVQILFDYEKLVGLGISPDQVMNILRAQNVNFPLGKVESGTKVYTLRVIGEYKNIDEIRKTVIGNKNGIPILLEQVADVKLGPSEVTSITRTNRVNSIYGFIQKRTNANTVKVCNDIVKEIENIKKELPSGVGIDVFFNQADFINRSIRSTADTLIIGAILAVLILFLFLGNLRAALIIGISLPITVFFAVFMMFIFNMTINMVSLGGLTIAIGMVVDCAIVVFEAIYRHRQEKGEEPDLASVLGTQEVGMAITASTLTTIAVFLPLLLVRGFASIFFSQIAWTVTFALASSLLVAVTIVPMLMAKLIHIKTELSGIERTVQKFYKRIEDFYLKIIRWALNHRKTIIFGTGGLFVLSLGLLFFIGAELTPSPDRGQIQIEAEMPVGTNLATTDSAIIKLEEILLKEIPEMENTFITIGSGTGLSALFGGGAGSNVATIWIGLVDREKRTRSVKDIQKAIRPKMNSIPGLVTRFTSDQSLLFGTGKPIEIKIIGYDLDKAKMINDELMGQLKKVKGLVDLESDLSEGKPEIQFIVDRYKAMQFGLTPYQIGLALRSQIEGMVASQYRIEGREYDIRITLKKGYKDTPEKIKALNISTPVGVVPLRNFLIDTMTLGPSKIEHENTFRVVKITGNVEGRDQNSVARDVQKILKAYTLPPGFKFEMGGGFREMQTTFRDIGWVILIAIFLVYIIMVGQFESLKEPFIIIFTIPLAIIGVLWILFFTNTTVNMQSLMGLLLLAGIVVNNAIVYVDYTNQLRRKQGMPLVDALIEAGRVRLRPIMMTALTTIFGLIPMALGIGAGSEIRAPMARSVIGGLLFATFLTLVFIPTIYLVIERRTKSEKGM